MLSVVVTDSSSAPPSDSNDVSQPPSTYLPAALEVSIPSDAPAGPEWHQENITAEPIVQDVRAASSTSDVPPTVTNGFRLDNPDSGISYGELDQASMDSLNSWQLLWESPSMLDEIYAFL
jgi:hypothetical protein